MTNLFDLMPDMRVAPKQHEFRQFLHSKSGLDFETSVDLFDFSNFIDENYSIDFPKSIPFASDPSLKDMPFGPVGTIETSGCIVLTAKVILDYFGYSDIIVEDILETCVSKGYRMWKFPKLSKSLNLEKMSLDDIKKEFQNNSEVITCKTLSDLYNKFGKPYGIGGSVYFLDNLIALLSNESEKLNIGYHTRIRNINILISNLEKGIPVPMRVNNRIYLDNPHKKGGHYVTLFAIKYGSAIVVDTSKEKGLYCLPFERLMEAAIEDPDLTCVWDLQLIKRK